VERKNKPIQEMERAMMDETKVANTLLGEATQRAIYLSNKVKLRRNNNKTSYELGKGRTTSIKHLSVFRSK